MKILSRNILSLLLVGLMIFSMLVISAGATVDGDSNIPDGLVGKVIINEDFQDENLAVGSTPQQINDWFEEKNRTSFIFRNTGGSPSSENASDTFSDDTTNLTVVNKGATGNKALKLVKTTSVTKNVELAFGLVKGNTSWLATENAYPSNKITTGIIKMSVDVTADPKTETVGKEKKTLYLPKTKDASTPMFGLSSKGGTAICAGVGYKTEKVGLYSNAGIYSLGSLNANAWINEANTFTHIDLYIDYTGATPTTWAVINGIETAKATPYYGGTTPYDNDTARNWRYPAQAAFGVYKSDETTGTYIDNLVVTHYREPGFSDQIEVGAPTVTGELTEGTVVTVTSKVLNKSSAQFDDVVLVATACDANGAIKGIVYGTQDIPTGETGADVTASFGSFPAGATQLKIFALKSFASLNTVSDIILYPAAQ